MFEDESIRAALDHALRNARHLRVRHSPAVAAARKIADRLDESDGRTDHVLGGTFMNYLVALGLLDAPAKKTVSKSEKSQPTKTGQRDDLAAMRKRVAG